MDVSHSTTPRAHREKRTGWYGLLIVFSFTHRSRNFGDQVIEAIVARQVQLEFVALASAHLTTSLDPLALPPDLEISLGYRAAYRLPEEHPDHVYVRVDQRFEAITGEGGASLLVLEVGYDLIYQLESAATYPEDALKYFAELNGPYNAWPYLRELVQTVVGRVGLGSVVLPVFRPERVEIETEEQAETVIEA